MQMREMAGAILVVLATALLGKVVAVQLKTQAEVEAHLGLVLETTGAAGPWATVVQVRLTLATTSDPAVAVAVAITAVAVAVRIVLLPAPSVAVEAAAVPV